MENHWDLAASLPREVFISGSTYPCIEFFYLLIGVEIFVRASYEGVHDALHTWKYQVQFHNRQTNHAILNMC